MNIINTSKCSNNNNQQKIIMYIVCIHINACVVHIEANTTEAVLSSADDTVNRHPKTSLLQI